MNENGNQLHGFDHHRVHKDHGKKRVPSIATQKDNVSGVTAGLELPVDHFFFVLCFFPLIVLYVSGMCNDVAPTVYIVCIGVSAVVVVRQRVRDCVLWRRCWNWSHTHGVHWNE